MINNYFEDIAIPIRGQDLSAAQALQFVKVTRNNLACILILKPQYAFFLYHLAHFHQELQYNSEAACSSIQMKAAKNHSACTMIFYKTTIHLYQELLCSKLDNFFKFESYSCSVILYFYVWSLSLIYNLSETQREGGRGREREGDNITTGWNNFFLIPTSEVKVKIQDTLS
jgi:hypothetical protein